MTPAGTPRETMESPAGFQQVGPNRLYQLMRLALRTGSLSIPLFLRHVGSRRLGVLMGLTRKDLAEKRVFLETMRGAPFDLEIRSVYADWLESHGDAKMADLNRILIWVLEESKRTLPADVPAWKSGREILFPFRKLRGAQRELPIPLFSHQKFEARVPALIYRTRLNERAKDDYYGPGWYTIFRPKWDKLHLQHDWIRKWSITRDLHGHEKGPVFWRLDGSFR